MLVNDILGCIHPCIRNSAGHQPSIRDRRSSTQIFMLFAEFLETERRFQPKVRGCRRRRAARSAAAAARGSSSSRRHASCARAVQSCTLYRSLKEQFAPLAHENFRGGLRSPTYVELQRVELSCSHPLLLRSCRSTANPQLQHLMQTKRKN